MSKRSISLDDAVQHPSLREEYLTSLCVNPIPHCSAIIYDPNCRETSKWLTTKLSEFGAPNKIIEQIVQGTHNNAKRTAGFPIISHMLGSGINAPLFVADPFFTQDHNESELLNILYHHEGTHLRQVAEGVEFLDTAKLKKAWIENKIRPKAIANILELEANYESLRRIQQGDSQVRVPFFQTVLGRYRSGIANLYNLAHDSQSQVEKEMILATLRAMPHTRS